MATKEQVLKAQADDKPNPSEPIRIFGGTSEYEDKWIERILVYTLLQNTDRKLEITMLRPSMFEDWDKTGWGTPFTCFRYAIPSLCNWKGRAIYMDCDQMNFRDIGELYDVSLGGCAFGMVWDTLNMNPKEFEGTEYERGWFSDSVIVIDCEKAAQYIDPIEEVAKCSWGYKNVFSKKIGSPYRDKVEDKIIKRIDARWNSFDGYVTDGEAIDRATQQQYDMDDIYHLHFTSLSSQIWHPKYSPHGKTSYPRKDIATNLWKAAFKAQQLKELFK